MHTRIQGEPLSPSTINRWIVASQQINLGVPAHRRRHRQARTKIVVALAAIATVAWLFAQWAWRMV